MKLSQTKIKILTNAVLADLETDVNTFLAAGGERTVLGPVKIIVDDGTYVAVVNYTE